MAIFNEPPLKPGQSGDAQFQRDDLDIIKPIIAYRRQLEVTLLER
jgi:hypothetical protein